MSDLPALPLELQRDCSLSRKQAACYLGISEPFLKKLDLTRQGPIAHRIGRRWTYLKPDLDAWREEHRYYPAQGRSFPSDREQGRTPRHTLPPQGNWSSEEVDPMNTDIKETERRQAPGNPPRERHLTKERYDDGY